MICVVVVLKVPACGETDNSSKPSTRTGTVNVTSQDVVCGWMSLVVCRCLEKRAARYVGRTLLTAKCTVIFLLQYSSRKLLLLLIAWLE